MTALPFRLQRIFARRPARLRLASAWRTLIFIVVLLQTLALLALAPLSAARADEPIKGEVKAVNDGGFLRLMFQFDEAVEATTRVSGAIVIISFNKPVALAVERLNVNAPDYISAARRDPDGSAIRLALLRKVKVNTIAAAERLYVDLLPEAWKGPMPGLPQEVIDELVRRARTAESQLHQQRAADKQKKPPVVRVKVATQPTFVRYVFTMPGTVNVIPERADGRLTLNFDQQVAWDLADAKASLPPTLKSIESEVDFDSVAVVFTLSGTPEVRAFREERSIVVDIGLEGAKPKQSEEVGPAKPAVASGGAPAISAPNSRSPKTSAAEILPPKTSAPPPAPVAAAAAPQEAGPAKPVPEAVPPKQAEQSQPAPAIAQPAMAVPAPQVLAASEPAATTPPTQDAAHAASQPAPAPAEPPPTASPAPPPARTITSPPIAATDDAMRPKANPNAVVVARTQQSGDRLRLEFPFAAPTPAAVFQRADTLWLVFDSPAQIDLTALQADNDNGVRGSIV